MITPAEMQRFAAGFDYPKEAQAEITAVYGRILQEKALRGKMDAAEDKLFDEALERDAYLADLEGIAEAVHAAKETIPMLCMVQGAVRLKKLYAEKGIDEDIWQDSMLDIRTKIMECKRLTGAYGFRGEVTPMWMVKYFRMALFALGRLQYEMGGLKIEECTVDGLTLHKGDPVLCCHIPSNGQTFDAAARLDSYKKAYAFFAEKMPAEYGGRMPITCDSWLLFPDHVQMLGQGSNIAGFVKEFVPLHEDRRKTHPDLWRIFGTTDTESIEALPEKTALQKVYKQRLLEGGDVGYGYGIFLFDGERIIR